MTLRAVVLSESPVGEVVLHWRVMGGGEFAALPMTNTGRGVWRATVAAALLGREEVEYYVQAGGNDGIGPVWPPTAPGINHTVTWIDAP